MRLHPSAPVPQAALAATPALAAPPAASPDALRREAMTRVSEAAQTCPDVWTAPTTARPA